MKTVAIAFFIISVTSICMSPLGSSSLSATKKPADSSYAERIGKAEDNVEKLRNELYSSAMDAVNRSGQETSRLITFVGIIATIFGVTIALAGGFIGYEGIRARRKSKEAIDTLDKAKSFVEAEVTKLKEDLEGVRKLLQVSLDQLKQDTEEAARKVTETTTRKIEEIDAIDFRVEREGKIDLLEKRIKLFEEIGMPDDPKVLYSKAMMCKEKGMNEEAVELLRRVVRLEPQNSNAYFQIAYLGGRLGRFQDSIEIYEKLIEMGKADAVIYNNMGVQFLKLQQLDKAIEYYSRAVEFDPKYAQARRNRIFALLDLKRLDEALGDIEKLLELEPNAAHHRWKAEILEGLNRQEDALASISVAIAMEPKSPENYVTKLMILNKFKMDEGRLETIRKLIELQPTNPNHRYPLARVLRKMGALNEAKKEYETACGLLKELITKGEANEGQLLSYAEISLVLGKIDDAEKSLQETKSKIVSVSGQFVWDFLFVSLLLLKGDIKEGFQKALEIGEKYREAKVAEINRWNFEDINPAISERLESSEQQICLLVEQLLKQELTWEQYKERLLTLRPHKT